MHHVILWKWTQPGFREAYSSHHVNKLAEALAVNLNMPHRIICITDDANGITACPTHELWGNLSDVPNRSGKHLPSCYRRLRLFDPAIQSALGIAKGDRIVSLDLDTLVTGKLSEIFGRKDRWVGWAVRGHFHPRVFNGSLWMFTAGDLEHMWTEFDPKTSPDICQKAGFFGSDQSWLSYKLANKPDTFGWSWPHVVSYPREVRVQRTLDQRTRIIFFHGARKPWHLEVQRESPWVHRYYKL